MTVHFIRQLDAPAVGTNTPSMGEVARDIRQASPSRSFVCCLWLSKVILKRRCR